MILDHMHMTASVGGSILISQEFFRDELRRFQRENYSTGLRHLELDSFSEALVTEHEALQHPHESQAQWSVPVIPEPGRWDAGGPDAIGQPA